MPLAFLAVLIGIHERPRAAVPQNLVADGIPEPTPELARRVAPYLEFRPATFLDWHPRRRDVLLATRLADVPQLHVVRLPMGELHPLTSGPERVTDGSFEPRHARFVVFTRDFGGNEFFQFHCLDLETKETRLLTDGKARHTSPRWAGSGRWMAYLSTRRNGRDTDPYVVDPRHPGSERRVAEWTGGGWSVLDWSADETSLLALDYVSASESSLHQVDVRTGIGRPLTRRGAEPVSYSGGAFLSDNRFVLTTSNRGTEFRHLARIRLEDGEETAFGPAFSWDVEEFEVSPDGKSVALLTNEDGLGVLHLLDARTGEPRKAPKLPIGVASDLRWHPKRRELALTLGSPRFPSDVFSVDLRANGITRWTRGETSGLDTARFAEPVAVRLASFDGLPVSGILYRPDRRRFPGPRPVLLHIHGGPEGQARPRFQRSWNYLVEEMGIAVLYPNVRGSDGYGKTFLTLDNGLRREDAVKDIGAFLDWIARQPDLDSGRVAVYGGSYGGYMVLASLVHFGERLRCGIDVVGISHFRTFLKNTQDYRRDLRRAEYGDERDPETGAFMDRISPLARVASIRKPLLVVQGANDPRVPASESEQLVRAIREHGGSAGYLLAKDEGHGFAKKPNIDYLFLCVVGFLERHLLGPDAGLLGH